MKAYLLLAALGLGVTSLSSQAATVECVISGTPTPQEWSSPVCASPTTSTASSVVFRLNTSKPVAEVSWTYQSQHSGRWDCRNGQYCRFSNYSSSPSGSAEACATRVLYKDGTWENLNSCAYGSYWHGSGPILKPFNVDVPEAAFSSEQLID
ncbi:MULTISPECIES: hypothetical protein [unclassified Pseudoalteromonas]|uniref:hypothetical protein n=1 Tax=unclassified Pseudoalteromonas TaxID=194690 RepID=UPI002097F347|nr:hypothetical protein [Pseudoalteromonas sp. XMcav2-N]MCO7188589.1 hypothetical protein [Pseudoalteromonas sp. XMcav2-N]